MASPGFTSYSVDNDNRFKNALKRAQEQSDDLRIPFTLIASDFYRSQKAIWKLSGPGQYKDLSSQYKKAKQKAVGFIYPILKRTGKLEAAASVQFGPGNITQVGPTSLLMGVNDAVVPYANYHQSDAPRTKIPLRKYLFIGPEAKAFASSDQAGRVERWLNIMNSYVLGRLKASGVEG